MFTALVSFWLVPLASTQTGPLAQMLEDLDGKLDEGGAAREGHLSGRARSWKRIPKFDIRSCMICA